MEKLLFIGNYGCQMNVSDAERMEGELKSLGYMRTNEAESASLIILNTCCVRETAEDKIYGKIGEIKSLKRRKPALIFGITGCMAQKEGEALIKRAPHIDFVLGTNKLDVLKNTIASLEEEKASRLVDTDLDDKHIAENVAVSRGSSLTAWVPVMYGCNNFCTYCIVPYVRGRERSRLPEDIIAEVKGAVKDGFKEITLLGQNVNSYGKDHKKADFADILRMVDEVEGIERVRFMTSHPKDLNERVINAVKEGEHICEHFHLPVQYGSDSILKAMNRVYTTAQYKELVQKIRSAVPTATLTTDLIVGFPGETEEDFAATLDFLREIRYDAAYTFLYSKRSGTPAATMDNQVADEVKRKRLHRLMELQDKISREINDEYNGATVEVMAEGKSRTDENVWTGRTRGNKIVLWEKRGGEAVGDLLTVKISAPQTWVLKGEAI